MNRLNLSKKFYSKESIEETADAFNEICKTNIIENNESFDIFLEPKEPEERMPEVKEAG